MSCDTLNRSAVQLEVAAGSLPEGFCPTNLQDFFNAIVQRLIISPSTDFNTFVIGSTAPSSNQGPWLKDCLEWFVFDDATATYIPMNKGGFDNLQYFTTSGTFVVPDFIYQIKIQAWGAGGGGAGNDGAGSNGSAGGGGAYGLSIVTVTPGQIIPITVGTGGAGGTIPGAGAAGSSTTVLTGTAGGGSPATSVTVSGAGGTSSGFTVGINGQNGQSNLGGVSGTVGMLGGDAGGGGGAGGSGMSNTGLQATRTGVSPGGGGAGGTGSTTAPGGLGGAGANGAVIIEW